LLAKENAKQTPSFANARMKGEWDAEGKQKHASCLRARKDTQATREGLWFPSRSELIELLI